MVVERPQNPEQLIGASCHEVIKEILRLNPDIDAIQFTTYNYIFQAIAKDRQEPHFWLDRDGILKGKALEKQIAELPEGYDLGIHSLVKMKDGSEKYLSLIDFKLSPSPENLEIIKERMKKIVGIEGFILETDKSYHFYGINPVDFDDWIDFCARCLLTSLVKDEGKTIIDVVSTRYIGHCLLRRANVLRISANVRKVLPTVVDIL